MNNNIKKYLKEICDIYGVKLVFRNGKGGSFNGDYIKVGVDSTKTHILSVFAHELAHFILWKKGKYPKYHNPRYFGKLKTKFKSYDLLVNYALKAEIATEKLGRSLYKEWFGLKNYKVFYKNTEKVKYFIYGYWYRD